MKRKYFFSWSNFRWFIKEIMKLYSDQPSYFSKKRVESGIAFVIAEWGAIFFLLNKWQLMTTQDFGIWMGLQLAVAGYIINQIQKEKTTNNTESNGDNDKISANS
ncbi:MAG: hypothetical protein ACOYOV_13960 [Bacteroidales bacterium]